MLSPLTWLLLAVALGWLGGSLGRRRRARGRWLVRVAAGVGVVSIVAMTPLAANALVGWLERPRPVHESCKYAPPAVAVVLAGGVDTTPTGVADLSALGISSRRRVERAAIWWREQPGRSLIMSGGPQRPGTVPTGAWMADYARRLGVSGAALRVEGGSNSTWENAMALASLQPAAPRRVVLVTSAMHMPRARYALGRAGYEACPMATDYRHIPFGSAGYLLPRSSALRKTEAALHEVVGMGYYRWLARGGSVRERTARGD